MTRVPIETEGDRLAYAGWKNVNDKTGRLVYEGSGSSIDKKKTFQLYTAVDKKTSDEEPLREEASTTWRGDYTLEAVIASKEVGAEIEKVIFKAREAAEKPKVKSRKRKSLGKPGKL